MPWIFFVLSMVVDIDEIYKSWNFERHSPFRFPARAFGNLGGSTVKKCRAVRKTTLRGSQICNGTPHNFGNHYLEVFFGVEFKSGIKNFIAGFLLELMRPKYASLFIRDQVWGGHNSKSKNSFIVHLLVNQSHIVELSTNTIISTLENQ